MRRRLAVGGSVLVAAALLAAVLVLAVGSGTSIVSRAYAATATSGRLLAYTVTHVETTEGIADGHPVHGGGPMTVSQVWSDGPRWHVVSSTPAFHGRYSQSTSGTTDIAVDGRSALVYSSARPEVVERLITTEPGCGRGGFALARSVCGDPIQQLHALLGSGLIRPSGHAGFRGRHADVLTGALRSRRGRLIATVRILVDPGTGQPFEVTATQRLANASTGSGYVLTGTVDTLDYHHLRYLSPTRANLALLRLRPHPGRTVITRHGA